MKSMNRKPGLLASILLLGVGSLAGANVFTAEQVEQLIPQIEQYMEQSMQQWGVPGAAIGIVAEDRLVYAKGFGERVLGSGQTVDPDTVFEIGSTSKAFTGVTQAIAVEEGLVDWDDRVIDLAADFRMNDPWVTTEFRFRDLLAQRSGLPGWVLTDMMLYGYSAEEMIRAIRYVKPVSSFRYEFAYQNVFHLLTARIIADKAGEERWESYLQKRVFDPLGMTRSFYRAEDMLEVKNVSSGHRFEEGQVTVDPRSVFPYNVVPAGGINSSVRDISQWLRMQINQGSVDSTTILSKEGVATTHQPLIRVGEPLASVVALGRAEKESRDTIAYATGWMIHSLPQGRVIEHGGATVGFISFIGFDPDRKVGVVVLSNLAYDVGGGIAMGTGAYIMDLIHGREPADYNGESWQALQKKQLRQKEKLSKPDNATPARPLSEYVGHYHSPTLGDVEVVEQEGRLYFELGPLKLPVQIEHLSGDRFKASVQLRSDYGKAMTSLGGLQFETWGGEIMSFSIDALDTDGQLPFVRAEEES